VSQGIAELVPGRRCTRLSGPHGIIHEVLRPLSGLPPELPIGGLDLNHQPVDPRVISGAVLFEGMRRPHVHVNLPDLCVTARAGLVDSGVPPPLARSGDLGPQLLLELAGLEVLFPQGLWTGLGERVLRVGPVRPDGVIRTDRHTNLFDLALAICPPRPPQPDRSELAGRPARKVIGENAGPAIAPVDPDIDALHGQVRWLTPGLVLRQRGVNRDLVVFYLAVQRRTTRTESALAADAESCEGLAHRRTVGHREGYHVSTVGEEAVEDSLCGLPYPVRVEIDPPPDHAPAAVDHDRGGRQVASNQGRDRDPVLVVDAVRVVPKGMGIRLTIRLGVGPIPVVAEPGAHGPVPCPVAGQPRRISGCGCGLRGVAPIILRVRRSDPGPNGVVLRLTILVAVRWACAFIPWGSVHEHDRRKVLPLGKGNPGPERVACICDQVRGVERGGGEGEDPCPREGDDLVLHSPLGLVVTVRRHEQVIPIPVPVQIEEDIHIGSDRLWVHGGHVVIDRRLPPGERQHDRKVQAVIRTVAVGREVPGCDVVQGRPRPGGP